MKSTMSQIVGFPNWIVGFVSVVIIGLGYGMGALQKGRHSAGESGSGVSEQRGRPAMSGGRVGSSVEKSGSANTLFEATPIDDSEQATDALRSALLAGNLDAASAQALLNWAERDPEAALKFFLNQTPVLRASKIRSAALEIIIGKLGLEYVEGQVLAMEDAGRKQAALRGLFSALASVSPRQAFSFAQRHNTWADSVSLNSALAAIAKESPQDALKLSATIPSRAQRATARIAVADSWGDTDPVAVLEWLQSEPSAELRGRMRNNALADLARIDFPNALVRANSITCLAEHRDALRFVLKEQVLLDPFGAMALLDDIPNRRQRNAVAGAMTDLWALSPDIVGEMLRRPDLRDSGFYAAETMLEREVFRNPEASLAFIQSLPPDARMRLEISWCQQMNNVAPDVAARYLAEVDINIHHGDAVNVLADRLTLMDPARAVQWADELEHSIVADDVRYRTLTKWAELSPEETVSALQTLDEENRPLASSYIGQSWAQHDPEKALSWLVNSGGSTDISEALGETIGVAAEQDSAYARTMFEQLAATHPEMLAQPAAMTAVNQIGQYWEGDRIADGGEWVAGLPQGVLRQEAAMGLMEPLAEQGAMQLYEKLQNVQQPDLRDAGLRLVASELLMSDLESAYEASVQISNPGMRQDSLNITLSSMLRQNPEAVLKLLQTDARIPASDIPELKRLLGLDTL